MAEKKRFKEPVLLKCEEKLDQVTRRNQLGSCAETEPKRSKKGRHWGKRFR